MHLAYLVSVWIHILAAIVWVGGMSFLVLIVVPWLRKGDRAEAATVFRETGLRFRPIGWTCFAIFVATGTFNLWMRGFRLDDVVLEATWTTWFGRAVATKIALFFVVVAASAVHDFVIGPRATAAVAKDPSSPEAERLRRWASLLGRINALVAIVLVALGVILVRGWPF